ncbi:MAG: amino acid ABC transporter ATP-binding protein [Spirochaetaceae bacterium]|jgi:L-cystine transport system ATP-binding protein|nr:amino acid ABC transporter ATP-binding protein [Spirochaetaceae bacterium]
MISIRSLNKSYGTSQVLYDINLDVAAGSVVVIIGPSGSGKSTLLRCINLLEQPQSGTITVDGEALLYQQYTKKEAYRLRRKTSMVFQGYNLFLHKTALANVEEGLLVVQKMPRHEARELAQFHLSKVGLSDKMNAYPAELSGGQQQRVAIARAVAMNPKVILFDEPTSALDPELVQEVLSAMKKVAAEGNTMIVVTHELAFARDLGTKIVFLEQGRFLEEGPAQEFFAHPQKERTRQFLQQFSTDYSYHI